MELYAHFATSMFAFGPVRTIGKKLESDYGVSKLDFFNDLFDAFFDNPNYPSVFSHLNFLRGFLVERFEKDAANTTPIFAYGANGQSVKHPRRLFLRQKCLEDFAAFESEFSHYLSHRYIGHLRSKDEAGGTKVSTSRVLSQKEATP